ncbi:MAG: hypothetical protein HZA68_20825 [Rhodovulum sp.]|nr:hypothetical protein [Rhodovulum sp.]
MVLRRSAARRRFTAALAIMLPATGAALADVRHTEVPIAAQGVFIPAPDSCPGRPEMVITVFPRGVVWRGRSCTLDWVEERAGTPGPIYSLHLRCPAPGSGDAAAAGAAGSPATAATILNVVVWPKSTDTAAIGPDFTQLADYRRCR